MPEHTRMLRKLFSGNFTLSWAYPLKGIYFFTRNRFLWPLLKARLLPLIILSLFITAVVFLALYLPQVALLALFHKQGSAWVNATFLVLEESTLIISIFFEAFLVDKTQVDIFDSVLVHHGHAALVQSRREVSNDEGTTAVTALGPREKGAEFAPFSFRQIIEFVLLLPLNFIPYAGVPLFLILTGYRAGPLLMWRYYKFKGFDKKARNAFIRQKGRRWQLMWFGTMHLVLQLVPILSLLALLTTAAGSALWVVDMENAAQRRREGEAEDGGDDGELPPPYTDEA